MAPSGAMRCIHHPAGTGARGHIRNELIAEEVETTRTGGEDGSIPQRGGATLVVDLGSWDVRYVSYKLALQADHLTNNTSLVLAFELPAAEPEKRKILLLWGAPRSELAVVGRYHGVDRRGRR